MSDPAEAGGGTPAASVCPICRKPPAERYRPFCSARCADVDLGRWFAEAYRIPGPAEDEAEEDGPARPSGGPKEGG